MEIPRKAYHFTLLGPARNNKLCGTQGPKGVVASLSAAAGGVLAASAPGQLPRGEKQVINFQNGVRFKDVLFPEYKS